MNRIFNFLFPERQPNSTTSLLLLALRLMFGLFFLWHGIEKWIAFPTLRHHFPDPLGIGSHFSLQLTLFTEMLCSLGVIFGLLHRVALIPMIFTMCIAVFMVHAGQPFAEKELALLYLLIFVLLFICGPGRYSVDRFIGEHRDE